MSTQDTEYRPDIDGLRAWAVMAVLLFHLDFTWMQGGFIGVDVFFVISGYLITRNIRIALEKNIFSLKSFYARRARRLMPSLFFTLIFTLIGMRFLAATTHLMNAAKSTLGATLSISNILFWKQTTYFDDALKLNPVTHTWSLSLEEQFYLLYPLILLVITRKYKSRNSLVWSLGLLLISSLCFSIWATIKIPAFSFFMVPSRLWEFALGGLIWATELNCKPFLKRSNLRTLLYLLGALFIWGSAGFLSEYDPFPGSIALIPCFGAGLVIMSKPENKAFGLLCTHPLIVTLGRLSYALYLVHWPLIVLYRHINFDLTLNFKAQICLGVLSLLIAIGLHHILEEPLRKRTILVGKLSLIHALVATTLLISVCSTLIWKQKLTGNHPALTHLRLPTDIPLTHFKRETYGGKGCLPPRCAHASETDPTQGQVSAYVIGDSYALALYQGLNQHLKAEQVVFWERGACEFYSLNYVGNMNKGQNSCIQTKRDAFTELKANPHIPVVLGQHWYGNSNEEMLYRPSAPLDITLPQDPILSIKTPSIDEYARFVAQELIQLKQTLGLKQLTILGAPPKFAHVFSPLDCFLSPLKPRPCDASPLDEFTQWHQTFQEALLRYAQGQFKVIDLYHGLCNTERCRNLTETGELIYSDYGHLSQWGAATVVQQQLDSFSEALNVPPKVP